jgi:urease accessory protein
VRRAAAGAEPVAAGGTGWAARLELDFAARGARTVLAARRHSGPLAVQRPFWPEGPDGACHVYLLHPPGGVVGGDARDIGITAGPGAHALVTTPAAGKLYRSGGAQARVTQRLRVAPGAALEWLAQPVIAYAGARARQTTRVDLAGDARFAGWEMLCLGRPHGGEAFAGTLHTAFEIWRDEAPCWAERMSCDATTVAAPWALRNHAVTGTLLACPVRDADAARAVLDAATAHDDTLLAGASAVDEVLAVRVLGPGAEPVHRALTAVWAALRPALFGRPACPPRVWNT